VAAYVIVNTTNSGPNYTTSRDVTEPLPAAPAPRRPPTTTPRHAVTADDEVLEWS
jgi:hypothetical protein